MCVRSILDVLRGEARVLEGLHNLGIRGEHQGKLLRLPVSAADDSYALDIRHPAIMVSPVWRRRSPGSAGGISSLCTHTGTCTNGSVVVAAAQPENAGY